MAAVFMISTSTLAMRIGITPRWTAFLGFACALLLLLSGHYIDWILLVFPLWVLLISIYILVDNAAMELLQTDSFAMLFSPMWPRLGSQ
jgi:ubiquitin C-terminal hydrolase